MKALNIEQLRKLACQGNAASAILQHRENGAVIGGYLEICEPEKALFYALLSLHFNTESDVDVDSNDLCLDIVNDNIRACRIMADYLEYADLDVETFKHISQLIKAKIKMNTEGSFQKPKFVATLSHNNKLVVACGDDQRIVLADAWRRGVEHPWLIELGKAGTYAYD